MKFCFTFSIKENNPAEQEGGDRWGGWSWAIFGISHAAEPHVSALEPRLPKRGNRGGAEGAFLGVFKPSCRKPPACFLFSILARGRFLANGGGEVVSGGRGRVRHGSVGFVGDDFGLLWC